MHNLLRHDGAWADQPHVGDHIGRAVWAAGTIAAAQGVPPYLRGQAYALVDDLTPLIPHLPAAGARSAAYAVLGLVHHDRYRAALAGLVDPIEAAWRASASPDWCWPEDRLTYDNARLIQAMLLASTPLHRPQTAARALVSLDWYLAQVGLDTGMLRCVGNRWRPRNQRGRDDGDEQPIDAAAIVETLITARTHTGDDRYATLALRAYRWFLGTNRQRAWLYDRHTGGCHDGLTSHGVNRNQGAESTIAYHQALVTLAAAGLVAVQPTEPGEDIERVPATDLDFLPGRWGRAALPGSARREDRARSWTT